MGFKPGTPIGSNLRLVRQLGRGAMGSVWVADHLTLHSQVAVKFMSASVEDDPVSVARFTREARAAANIKSPHVVRMFDHGATEDGVRYLVMELLDGDSLDKRLRTTGPLNLIELAKIVSQVCKALADAHALGIIHRDIKPANIFLTDSGGELFVRVLDFGVAKFTAEEAIQMTTAGNMVGTPAYMSPEQIFDAGTVDHRTDLWSLGVVAYQALTGKLPFKGVTLGEICVSIKRGEFIPVGALRGDASPHIDDWFATALNIDAAGRFASAKQMAEELELAVGLPTMMASAPSVVASHPRYLDSGSYGRPVTFPGPASSIRAPPGGRRSRVLVVLASALLALAAGGLAAFLLVGQRGLLAPAASAPSGLDRGPAAGPSAVVGRPVAGPGAGEPAGTAAAGASASAAASSATGAPGPAPSAEPTGSARSAPAGSPWSPAPGRGGRPCAGPTPRPGRG
ncbi:MAG: serine/threonine protein kinase [Deltaproteobacteria bacterium]|nr:serine/threonine protein kinase [Deltaproteobacteria bacterium]